MSIMSITNEHSETILKKYLDQAVIDSQKMSFFILSWPDWIWKTEIVKKYCKEILGDYFIQDFLYVKDFSKELWKTHILKVEQKDENDVSKQLLKDFWYVDIWVREINSWLNLSSTWNTKILLIENIDRMNDSSYNAFLKTCEELLPNKIIIATTANKSKLLTTIISRAVVIPFYEYSYEDMIKKCNDEWFFENNEKLKEFICLMLMWKPNLLWYFDEKLKIDESLSNQILNIVPVLKWNNIADKYNALLSISKWGLFDYVLDWLIAYYVQNEDFESAQIRLKIKDMNQSNVKLDHLLFYGVL